MCPSLFIRRSTRTTFSQPSISRVKSCAQEEKETGMSLLNGKAVWTYAGSFHLRRVLQSALKSVSHPHTHTLTHSHTNGGSLTAIESCLKSVCPRIFRQYSSRGRKRRPWTVLYHLNHSCSDGRGKWSLLAAEACRCLYFVHACMSVRQRDNYATEAVVLITLLSVNMFYVNS